MKYKKNFLALTLIFALFTVFFCMSGSAQEVTKADIVFFVDASASMTDYIQSVKDNVAAFSRSLVSDDVDARFSIVRFKDMIDYDFDYNVKGFSHDVKIYDWTGDVNEVVSILDSIEADGYNETQTQALDKGLDLNYRSDAAKFTFLLTDEITEAHDYSSTEHFITIDELVPRFKKAGIPVSVISKIELREHYSNLFSGTGGVFVDITQGDFYKSMLDIARWIGEQVTTENPLPYAMIEPVSQDILDYVDSNGETVLQRIAKLASIDVKEINVITVDSIDLMLPREPTEEMRKKANGEFIAKTDTLIPHSTFLNDGEDGYYLFQLNIPDEVLSMDLNVKDIELWFAAPDEFETTSEAKAKTSFDPFSYYEITNIFGYKADKLEKKVLVLLFCNTGKSLSMWLLKLVFILLGGCNGGSGIVMGSSLAVLAGCLMIIKFFKKY